MHPETMKRNIARFQPDHCSPMKSYKMPGRQAFDKTGPKSTYCINLLLHNEVDDITGVSKNYSHTGIPHFLPNQGFISQFFGSHGN